MSAILIGLGAAILASLIFGLGHIQQTIARGNEINIVTNARLAEVLQQLKKLDAIYESLNSISNSAWLLSERFEAPKAYEPKAAAQAAELKRVLDNLVRPVANGDEGRESNNPPAPST